jgi:hypothetical protein
MTPTLFDLALKAGFSDPIEGWMGEAYEERLEAFAKLIIDHEIATKIANVTGELMDKSVALETVYETIIHWDEGGGKRSRRELARRIVALYTTPPAAPVQELIADPFTYIIQHLNSNPYSLTKNECIDLIKKLRDSYTTPPATREIK